MELKSPRAEGGFGGGGGVGVAEASNNSARERGFRGKREWSSIEMPSPSLVAPPPATCPLTPHSLSIGWRPVTRIASERRATEAVRTFTLWQALYNPTVLLLALNFLGIAAGSLGMLIFIPQIIKSLGSYSNMTVGWLTMIPYICGAIAMVVWGRISDRMNERRWNLFIACVFSTVGLVIAGMTMGTWWALVGMSIAAMGFYGSKGPFFAMPPMFLSGAGLAAGIAWINSIGNLGGFFGPWYVGVMKDLTGSYAGGLYGLALLGLVAAIVCAVFLRKPHITY